MINEVVFWLVVMSPVAILVIVAFCVYFLIKLTNEVQYERSRSHLMSQRLIAMENATERIEQNTRAMMSQPPLPAWFPEHIAREMGNEFAKVIDEKLKAASGNGHELRYIVVSDFAEGCLRVAWSADDKFLTLKGDGYNVQLISCNKIPDDIIVLGRVEELGRGYGRY